jgi:hypothetical protein
VPIGSTSLSTIFAATPFQIDRNDLDLVLAWMRNSIDARGHDSACCLIHEMNFLANRAGYGLIRRDIIN